MEAGKATANYEKRIKKNGLTIADGMRMWYNPDMI